jgi:hypothetical protein
MRSIPTIWSADPTNGFSHRHGMPAARAASSPARWPGTGAPMIRASTMLARVAGPSATATGWPSCAASSRATVSVRARSRPAIATTRAPASSVARARNGPSPWRVLPAPSSPTRSGAAAGLGFRGEPEEEVTRRTSLRASVGHFLAVAHDLKRSRQGRSRAPRDLPPGSHCRANFGTDRGTRAARPPPGGPHFRSRRLRGPAGLLVRPVHEPASSGGCLVPGDASPAPPLRPRPRCWSNPGSTSRMLATKSEKGRK